MLIEKSPRSLTDDLKEVFEKEDQLIVLYKKKISNLERDNCTLGIRLNESRKKIRREKIVSILFATAWATTIFLWIFFS